MGPDSKLVRQDSMNFRNTSTYRLKQSVRLANEVDIVCYPED